MGFVCNLGQNMTDQFDELSEELHQCNWYSFPLGLQKMYAILVHNAQQKMCLKGDGNLQCSRTTMQHVTLSEFRTHSFTISSNTNEIFFSFH